MMEEGNHRISCIMERIKREIRHISSQMFKRPPPCVMDGPLLQLLFVVAWKMQRKPLKLSEFITF